MTWFKRKRRLPIWLKCLTGDPKPATEESLSRIAKYLAEGKAVILLLDNEPNEIKVIDGKVTVTPITDYIYSFNY